MNDGNDFLFNGIQTQAPTSSGDNKSLLEDDNDFLFNDIQTQIPPAFIHSHQTVEIFPRENNMNKSQWSDVVKKRIESVRRENVLAPALEDTFWKFEDWPAYMVELFVLNNVSMYSYRNRNKISLFFWGNGATVNTMFQLSEIYAPRISLLSYQNQRDFSQSKKKCIDLFKTYSEQLFNPNYSMNYYYYNLTEKRMLYIDNNQRHHGTRQEQTSYNNLFRFVQ